MVSDNSDHSSGSDSCTSPYFFVSLRAALPVLQQNQALIFN